MKAFNEKIILRNVAIDPSGGGKNLIAAINTPVTVYETGTTNLASLFDLDENPIANPVNTDIKGNVVFKVVDGIYDVVGAAGTQDETRWDEVEINSDTNAIKHYTLAEAKALTGAVIGQIVRVIDSGDDIGALWEFRPTGEKDIGEGVVQSTGSPSLILVMRTTAKYGGLDYVGSAAERDSVYVGRTLEGLTDCHAFTDRTIITNVTDAGTYGTFDAVTAVSGNHTQSHLFAFQNRTIYDGSGSIGSMGNINWSEHTGTGNIDNLYGWWVKDINITGGGTVSTNIGIFIEDLSEANSNSAITLSQSTGYSVFAPNAGEWLLGGRTTIDGSTSFNGGSNVFNGNLYAANGFKAGGLANATAPIAGIAITIDKDGNAFQGFADINSLGVSFGVIGDERVQLVSNSAVRVAVGDSTTGYEFAPTSQTQNLGSASFLWQEVFSHNPAINTSDERLKTFIGGISGAEARAAIKLKSALKSFKFNDALARESDGGNKARIHFGIGVQTLQSIFESEGLIASDYAMFCYDEWSEIEEVRDEAGNIIQKKLEAGNRYGVRYTELLSFIVASI